MKRFLKNYRLPENIEVLFMLMIGIVLQITDGSPFSLEQRWLVVWETELPSQYFSQFVQKFIKTVLSIIVVVRCLTTYAYVVSAMLVICSIIKNTSPKLMLLWLLIAAIKSIFMTILEALTGVYVCSAFGKIRKACIEFFISKALEIIFAAYLWASVLNIYHEMERKEADSKKPETWEQLFMQKKINSLQRTRSLLDQSTLYKTACLNYFEFKDVPQIILQMLRREEEMSEDSLLGPGMMLASVSNLGSFDNLKTSQSLGELGLVDLKSTQVMGLEDDEMLSLQDKALKFLKLTWSDVREIQQNQKTCESEVYVVDDDTWNKLAAKRANVNKPKQPRAEIFLKEIPGLEKRSEEKIRKNSKRPLELKFGWSLINFFQEQDAELNKTFEDEEILSIAYNQEETDDCDNDPPFLMSNIRDEILVNRIRLDFVSKAAKGISYANLYKQDYMSVIGPEVFERASKLPKVTSFTKYHEKMRMRSSSSLPTFSSSSDKWKRKITFEEVFINKEEITSKSDLGIEQGKEQIQKNSDESLILELRKRDSDHRTSVENSIKSEEISCYESVQDLPRQEIPDDPSNTSKKAESEISEEQNQSTKGKYLFKFISNKFNKEDMDYSEQTYPNKCRQEKTSCFKVRRINIKRIGRRINVQVGSDISLSNDKTPPNEPENVSNNSSASKTVAESLSANQFQNEPESTSKTSESDDSPQAGFSGGDKNEIFKSSANQLFFFSELKHQPLIDVLITHNDLKRKIIPQRNINELFIHNSELQNPLFRTYRTLKKGENDTEILPLEDNIRTKVWKSKVLKTVTAYHSLRTESCHRSLQDEFILNLFTRKIAMEKILARTHRELLSERFHQVRDKHNILKDGKKSEYSIPDKAQDDYIVKSYVFLDSSDSKDSVGNRNIRENKNTAENRLLMNTSTISLLNTHDSDSDDSEKCVSCTDLKNIISRKLINNNEDKAVLELDTNKPQLIRNWLNSSFTEESENQNSNYGSAKISEADFYQECCEKLENNTSAEELVKSKEGNKRKGLTNATEVLNNIPDQDSFCSQDSDEPFSLYYSKAADLASPLLDMRRFIYPDHIHYSYKHVKKKGFDVAISGGLPLIVRESLTMNTPVSMKNVSAPLNPEIGITRKPMDLSFATTNAFTEWQNNDKSAIISESSSLTKDSWEILQNHQAPKTGNKSGESDSYKTIKKGKQSKRSKDFDQRHWSLKREENKKSKSQPRNSKNTKNIYLIKNYLLLQKFLKMYKRKINMEVKKSLNFQNERSPTQISSTQLHSNKGRINSTYNPAISLHENKTRTEKKKMETQVERTKVMFARLEREVLLQNKYKNAAKTFGPLRHI